MKAEKGYVFVRDLSACKFTVPSYQRGYRWEPEQVEALLNDVCEFNDSDGAKYCLQPIVIRPKEHEDEYEVIDGQQRLTTIFIILKYAYQGGLEEDNPSYSISYDTRSLSKGFLENELGGVALDDCDTPDMFYMQSAWNTIDAWKKEKGLSPITFLTKIVSKIEESVMLIWYEIDKDQDPISMFRKLNMGKIPLTNAELVKALIFSSLKQSPREGLLSEISSEWDNMEQQLQDDGFWFFLTNGSGSPRSDSTRIDLIINTWAEKSRSDPRTQLQRLRDPYYAFRTVSEKLGDAENPVDEALAIWSSMLDVFSSFQCWYKDNDLYHQIGYLIATGTKDAAELLNSLVELDKSRVNEVLEEFIRDSLKDERTADKLRSLDLGDARARKEIRKVLLLFNIRTIMDTEGSNTRFPFWLYKEQNWDIEHVHATASKPPTDEDSGSHECGAEARRKFFQLLANIAEDLKEDIDISADVLEGLHRFIDGARYENEKASCDFLNGACQSLLDDIETAQNSISNLTLLDASTNRGYGNDSFDQKRGEIIARDRTAVFIPPCTKNVFLKYYTPNPADFGLWNGDDRFHYIDGKYGLVNTLSRYLEEDIDE